MELPAHFLLCTKEEAIPALLRLTAFLGPNKVFKMRKLKNCKAISKMALFMIGLHFIKNYKEYNYMKANKIHFLNRRS